MSLQKNVYSPGQWYPYFYIPPKSPEMSLYYRQVETQLSWLYSFLPKDQIHGKILDFLGVPSTGGKIHKSKLHKIFLFETSLRGRKMVAKQGNRVEEVKIDPPKSVKPYEGPFKFFTSKNLRKLSQEASRASGSKSLQRTSLKEPRTTTPIEVTSHTDEESEVGYVPPSSRKVATMGKFSKQEPKKLVKQYEGAFKVFKSKNSREGSDKSMVDVQATSSIGSKSAQKTRAKEDHTAGPIEVVSDGDESDVQYVPPRSKMMDGTSRKPKRPEDRSNKQFHMKIIRHRPRTSSPLWYENTVSPESSKSYSVESDEDSAIEPNSSSKIQNKCCSSDRNTVKLSEADDMGKTNFSKKSSKNTYTTSLGAKNTTKPKAFDILSSDDSHDDPPASRKLNENIDDIFKTLDTEETVHDYFHGRDWLGGPTNDHVLITDPAGKPLQLATPKTLLPDENMPQGKSELDKVNPNRKTVEFRNSNDYYYYYKDSSSLTQRSSSSHRSAESRTDVWTNDSLSDDNEYDTGFVSPVMMSQESQLMSQDMQTSNTSGNSRYSNEESSSWVCERVPPTFPQVIVHSPSRVWPGRRSSVEVSPKNAASVDQNRSLVLQNVQQLSCSPVLSQVLSSVSQPPIRDCDMFLPDLELVRRIGSLRPGDEDNLSQISAATEIFSARVMVDLRNPGAYEAIHQHCRSIFEAVNSQNIFTVIPRAISLTEQRRMLAPLNQSESGPLVQPPIGNVPRTSYIDGNVHRTLIGNQQKIPLSVESLEESTDAHVEVSELHCSTRTYSQSALAEGDTKFYPRPQDIEASHGGYRKTPHFETITWMSRTPHTAEESIADSLMLSQPSDDFNKLASSMIPQKKDDSNTLTTPERRKKLPFKKRLPVLSAPKLKIIASNERVSVETKNQDAAATAKHSSVASVEKADIPAAEMAKPSSAIGVGKVSSKNSAASANFKPSSIACVKSRSPMNRVNAANVKTSLADAVKMASSADLAIAVNVKISSAAREKTASSNESDTENVKNSSVASVKTASSKKCDAKHDKNIPVASGKTSSSMNLAAATNKSSSAASVKADSDGPQQDAYSHTAEKSKVVSHLDSKKGKTTESLSNRGNVGAGSHSSKGSLKEWQRQANLAWKMSLPHISHQFFNDPEMKDARFLSDDVTSRSGVTWSEPSSRVKLRNDVDPRSNPPGNVENPLERLVETCHEPEENSDVYLDETVDRNTAEVSGSPSPRSNLGALSPFMRDFLFTDSFNPSRPANPNDVDSDAETQLKIIQHNSNMDAPSCERDYSRDLNSFLDNSIASHSTAENASVPGGSHQPPAGAGQSFPVWWQLEYSTPKHSFLEEESATDDSMQVILPRSQVQRDQALNAPTKVPAVVGDSFPQNCDPLPANVPIPARREASDDTRTGVQRWSSVARTRVMSKPPTSENHLVEHDFFISLAQQKLATFCNPGKETERDDTEQN